MSNSKGQSTMRSIMNNGKSSLLPPKIPFPTISPSYAEFIPSSAIGPRPVPKGKDENSHHHRASSESFSMEEKPSWLDELLDEPETPVRRGGHRRSSSDSFAYVDAANFGNMNMNYLVHDDNKNNNVATPVPYSWGSQDFELYRNARQSSNNMDLKSWGQNMKGHPWNSPLGTTSIPSLRANAVPANVDADEKLFSIMKKDQVEIESGVKDPKQSTEQKDFPLAKSSEAESKRAKQQFAQRSRVRKLQYIAELERNVQALQAEISETSGEIEFFNQKNLILSMENKALRQRMDSLSQEQLIKYFEQKVLEKEVHRLRSLYQQQQERRASSSANGEDLDQQFATVSIKNKEEANPGRNSVSGQLRM